MSLINWIVLALAVVVHWRCQVNGHRFAMSSSYSDDDENHDLNRLETANGVAQIGAIIAFISQWIPIVFVRWVGFIALGVAILAFILMQTGLLQGDRSRR
jgi:hypothetical protein